jgi:8-oxo-dGTP diphosphatase
MRLPIIDVAVSIVRASDGRVLLAERTARQVAAGYWELPGGKIDPGESAAEAAARELEEEVGIRATGLRPWIAYEHAFRTKRIRLRFFRVDGWTGEPRGREGQRLAWVHPAAPEVAPLLPSNERVLGALALPPLCAVVDADSVDRLPQALYAGWRLFLVREARLAPDQRIALARRVTALARSFGSRVLMAGSTGLHDAADLRRAVSLGADLALLSPVLTSTGHPGRPPLGWDGLQQLATGAPIPVFAQGGLRPSHLSQAQACGAAGIAVPLPLAPAAGA